MIASARIGMSRSEGEQRETREGDVHAALEEVGAAFEGRDADRDQRESVNGTQRQSRGPATSVRRLEE